MSACSEETSGGGGGGGGGGAPAADSLLAQIQVRPPLLVCVAVMRRRLQARKALRKVEAPVATPAERRTSVRGGLMDEIKKVREHRSDDDECLDQRNFNLKKVEPQKPAAKKEEKPTGGMGNIMEILKRRQVPIASLTLKIAAGD